MLLFQTFHSGDSNNPIGFSMKMIMRDPPASHLHPENLTNCKD